MAPTHSRLCLANHSAYFFSASRLRNGGLPNVIECVAAGPPHRVRGVQLTALRDFKKRPLELKSSLRRRDTQEIPTPGPSGRPSAPAPSSSKGKAVEKPSLLTNEDHNFPDNVSESSLSSISSSPPSSPATTSRAFARARSPRVSNNFPSASTSRQPVVPPTRLTRSSSRSSIKGSSGTGKRPSAMDEIKRRLAENGEIVTAYGEQDDKPIFIRDSKKTSTTEPDIITYYWESFTSVPLRQPPNLTKYPDLTVGDIYCNIVLAEGQSPMPQVWIWTPAVDGTGYWKRASPGDVREDGRRLTITPRRLQPSWVKPDWGVKWLRNPNGR